MRKGESTLSGALPLTTPTPKPLLRPPGIADPQEVESLREPVHLTHPPSRRRTATTHTTAREAATFPATASGMLSCRCAVVNHPPAMRKRMSAESALLTPSPQWAWWKGEGRGVCGRAPTPPWCADQAAPWAPLAGSTPSPCVGPPPPPADPARDLPLSSLSHSP